LIESHVDTTGCDKISLTHKTLFRILNSRKSHFLSTTESPFPGPAGKDAPLDKELIVEMLLGAHHGEEAIPPLWLTELETLAEIRGLLAELP
jgi:hypothetical protein